MDNFVRRQFGAHSSTAQQLQQSNNRINQAQLQQTPLGASWLSLPSGMLSFPSPAAAAVTQQQPQRAVSQPTQLLAAPFSRPHQSISNSFSNFTPPIIRDQWLDQRQQVSTMSAAAASASALSSAPVLQRPFVASAPMLVSAPLLPLNQFVQKAPIIQQKWSFLPEESIKTEEFALSASAVPRFASAALAPSLSAASTAAAIPPPRKKQRIDEQTAISTPIQEKESDKGKAVAAAADEAEERLRKVPASAPAAVLATPSAPIPAPPAISSTGAVATSIPVNRVPILFDRLLKCIQESAPTGETNACARYDQFALQTLLLSCVMDTRSFASEEDIFQFVRENVVGNEKFMISRYRTSSEAAIAAAEEQADEPRTKPLADTLKLCTRVGSAAYAHLDPIPKPSYDEEHDKKVVDSYHDLMNSSEMARLRSWREEEMPEWSSDMVSKFEEASRLYQDSSRKNAQIAKYINKHCQVQIHANHVAFYKRKLQSQQRSRARRAAAAAAAAEQSAAASASAEETTDIRESEPRDDKQWLCGLSL